VLHNISQVLETWKVGIYFSQFSYAAIQGLWYGNGIDWGAKIFIFPLKRLRSLQQVQVEARADLLPLYPWTNDACLRVFKPKMEAELIELLAPNMNPNNGRGVSNGNGQGH
jgi:hypothetical protein